MKFNTKPIILMGSALLALASLSSGCADHTPDELVVIQAPVDTDGDGVFDNGTTNIDNCKFVVNPLQEDTDDDGVGDACEADTDGDGICDGVAAVSEVCSAGPDNCRMVQNHDQMNTDMDLEDEDMTGTVGDPEGDACDTDDDNDGLCDPLESGVDCDGMDLCQYTPSENNNDTDGDGFADPCDNDRDGDGVRNDGVGLMDNCPDHRNQAQADFDADGQGDVCDTDDDNDGICDPGLMVSRENAVYLPISDCSGWDNCPLHCNSDQLNTDMNDGNTDTAEDFFGDACDQDPEGDGIIDFQWWAPEMQEWACGDNNVTCTLQNAAVVCDDDSNCTTDWCTEGGECAHSPVVCDDDNECTTNSCDPETGCNYVALSCVDANMCNGLETCNPASGCVAGTSTPTDDLNQCTNDACDPTTGAVTHTPLPTINDVNACTTDLCDTSTGTITHPAVNCDDSNSTTTDSCNSADTDGDPCVHTPVGEGPMVTIKVTIPARGDPSSTPAGDVYFYFGGPGTGGSPSVANAGNAYTIEKTISLADACAWGVHIAVAQPGTNLFWDCPLNGTTPTKFTPELMLWVNNVSKDGTSVQNNTQCSGQGPGDLRLSEAQLGCAL